MSEPKKPVDVIRPVAVHASTGHVLAVRTREGVNEIVGLARCEEGKPIMGEAVTLKERTDGAYDCETITGRPARVASAAYRAGWDAVFGGRKGSGEERPN